MRQRPAANGLAHEDQPLFHVRLPVWAEGGESGAADGEPGHARPSWCCAQRYSAGPVPFVHNSATVRVTTPSSLIKQTLNG
jgi:hypothetical protein